MGGNPNINHKERRQVASKATVGALIVVCVLLGSTLSTASAKVTYGGDAQADSTCNLTYGCSTGPDMAPWCDGAADMTRYGCIEADPPTSMLGCPGAILQIANVDCALGTIDGLTASLGSRAPDMAPWCDDAADLTRYGCSDASVSTSMTRR